MSQIRVRISFALAILAFGLLAPPVQVASAASYTDTTADFGGQGIVIPAGLDPETLDVAKLSPVEVAAGHVKFLGPILDIHFSTDGQELASPASLAYVYFNMNANERVAWDRGTADIYYQDRSSGSWNRCGSTFLVEGANPPHGRLACIAPQFTMFGVGISPTLESLLPGVEFSEGVVNAFYDENSAQFGDQGVFIPSGIDRNLVAVRVLDLSAGPETPFKVRRLMIQMEWMGDQIPFLQQQGQLAEEQDQPEASIVSEPAVPINLTYVFYNLDSEERFAWDEGNLSIYYYDRSSNDWIACPTFFVAQTQEGSFGRAACVAPQFTLYALGISQADEGSSE